MPVYKLVDGREKAGERNVKNFNKQVTELKEKVKPKGYQCISMDGHIIIEGKFDPDAIIEYRVPRKPVDYGIDRFPGNLQEEMNKLKNELNLTKEQVREVSRTLKKLDLKVIDLEKQHEIMREKARALKAEADLEKHINDFNKRYLLFFECLNSTLGLFNKDTKEEIKIKLDNMVEVINNVQQAYISK